MSKLLDIKPKLKCEHETKPELLRPTKVRVMIKGKSYVVLECTRCYDLVEG